MQLRLLKILAFPIFAIFEEALIDDTDASILGTEGIVSPKIEGEEHGIAYFNKTLPSTKEIINRNLFPNF